MLLNKVQTQNIWIIGPFFPDSAYLVSDIIYRTKIPQLSFNARRFALKRKKLHTMYKP